MSVNQYKLPDPGEGLTEAEIVTWRVKVGDTIKINDIVVEIETAKSLVELPSPYAGTVTALLAAEGEVVEVGTPIISVSSDTSTGTPGAAYGGPGGAPGDNAPGDVAPADVAGEEADERQPTLVGYGPRAASGQRRSRTAPARPASASGEAAQLQVQGSFEPGLVTPPVDLDASVPDAVTPAPPATAATPEVSAGIGAGRSPVLAKPPVRKLAKDLGVDLRSITASGPAGTITRADVEAAAGSGARSDRVDAPDVSPTGRLQAASSSDGPARSGERETREPIKGVRRRMAEAMVASAFTAPHVTEWVSVDATATMRLVKRLASHRDFAGVKVSPLLVVAKAVCLAVRRTPEVNATWDEAATEIVLRGYVNLGIAAATPRGLVVPNIKDAHGMPLVDLAKAITELTATAREGKTSPAQMAGGSFTITNVGVFGIDAGTPIINPGESAILCMGAIRQQPWVHKGKVKARAVTTLALSFDHRLIDGAMGSRFLADVASVVEDPSAALLL